ncbi:MAG TPA: hypothetical protein VG347_16585, partial [Verrucomicrobiae bacterium]|nr:hypothetical protein [Verrucomicrobiae bacterium]
IFENQKNRQYGPLHPSPRQRPGVRQSSGAFLESQANLTANRWKTNPPACHKQLIFPWTAAARPS